MGVAKPWHERHHYDRRELDEDNENDVHDSQPWYPRHERYTVSSVARTILLVLGLAALGAIGWKDAAAQTISVTPTSGTITAPATPTVTWDCGAGATSALASGNWSGAKAVSGTQTLGSFPAATHNFALTCTYAPAPVNGSALLTWQATGPLDGFNVYYGTSCTALNVKVNVPNAALTTATVSNLAAGAWCFGVTAYNAAGESAMSNTATKTIAANQPTTKTVSAPWTVNALQPPPPPTNLTVKDVVAFEIKANSTGTLTATRVGIVPDGTECISARTQKVGSVTYMQVPREKVDLVNWPQNTKLHDVWAKCS